MIIDYTFVGRRWLHLKKNGITVLVKNFSKVANAAWYCNGSDGEVYDNSDESTITISKRCHLGNLRLKKD